MDGYTIVLIIVLALVAIFVMQYIFNSPTPPPSNYIQSSTLDGKKSVTSNQVLPESYDQKQGITFSYTCWVMVEDFAYRVGQQKVIFTKGPENLSSACPALLLDANTNSLLVKIDTFGSSETIPIGNIPAKKWIHFGLAVDQDSVDVYINGILHTHHTLTQMPRQNNDTVRMNVGGGFDGKLALLEYYPFFMGPDDIKNSMATSPTEKKEVTPLPPYFDMSWWTKSA